MGGGGREGGGGGGGISNVWEHLGLRVPLQSAQAACPSSGRVANAPIAMGSHWRPVARILRNTLSTQNHAAGIARHRPLLFSVINVKDSVMKSKCDKVSGCPHSFNDGIMRATDELIGVKRALVFGCGLQACIELPSFNVATTMAAKPYTVEVYQSNGPGALTYDFGKEEVGTADIKAEKWPLMDSTVDALRERLMVITAASPTQCLPSCNGDAQDFAENCVLTGFSYQGVYYRNIESRVYAGAKDETLPDPEEHHEPRAQVHPADDQGFYSFS